MQRLCTAGTAFLFFAGAAWAAEDASGSPQGPTGEWLVAKQVARIKIVDCDDRLWGIVTWEAQPGVDSKNPNPNLRSRPTLGMPVLLGLTQTKPNQWEGNIYNSQNGNTYSASIGLVDPNTLRVRGCFLSILCGGENWTRVQPSASADEPQGQSRTRQKSRQQQQQQQQQRQAGTERAEATDICSRLVGSARLPHERRLK